MSRCRSCDAQIVWARHHESQSNMPLDAAPVSRDDHAIEGLYVTRRVRDQLTAWPAREAVRLTGARNELSEAEAWASLDRQEAWRVSHFATCPNADAHRRPR